MIAQFRKIKAKFDRGSASPLRLFLALLLLLISLAVGLSMDSDRSVTFVRAYGYFFTLFGTGLFLVYLTLWILCENRKPVQLKVLGLGVLTVLAGSVVVFHGSELDYKILMDDYLLAGTAKSLHESGEVSVAVFGREIDGEFHVVQSFVDKRPWFYPFLVSLVHDVAGYDPIHPFAVNAVLAVCLLGLVFAIGYCLGGLAGGVLSVLLWATLPLLQQNATGGGMEMLNLVMIHVLILLSVFYLRAPNERGEAALCLGAVLLTYTRYESGLFIGAVLLVLALGWWQKRRIFLSLPAICAAPLLLAAFAQTRIYAASESAWELAPGVDVPFSPGHLWANLPHAFVFFWSRDPAIANSLWLGLLAIPSVLGFVYLGYCRRGSAWWLQPVHRVWSIFAFFLFLSTLVVLSFHAAQFDSRYVARYSLPAHALIVFSTVTCLAALRPQRWIQGGSIALTLLFILMVTWSKNGRALYTKANFMIAEQHWLEAMDAVHVTRDTLVLDRFNTAWTLRERAALSPHVGWIHLERLKSELAAGKYSQILLVERLVDSSGRLETESPAVAALRDAFSLELLEQESFLGRRQTRLYRLGR